MKYGMIGAGKMGTAIVEGFVKAGACASDIIVSGHHPEHLEDLKERLGIAVAESEKAAAEASDVLIIAVKPKDMAAVIAETGGSMKEDAILVSIAAGKSIADIEKMLGKENAKVVRVMPNTPAMVGEGMSALCRNAAVSDEDMAAVMEVFNATGRASEVAEGLMDAVTGLSGSGPAYVYIFIEALADGAVLNGMPRAQAYEFAAQTVLGSAKMVLETGRHPGALKDDVCSPAGTTIEAVRALENGGLRSTVISAVSAAAEKSKNM